MMVFARVIKPVESDNILEIADSQARMRVQLKDSTSQYETSILYVFVIDPLTSIVSFLAPCPQIATPYKVEDLQRWYNGFHFVPDNPMTLYCTNQIIEVISVHMYICSLILFSLLKVDDPFLFSPTHIMM
jgi:hypothetical protein